MPNDSVFGSEEPVKRTRSRHDDDMDYSEDELAERDQEDGPPEEETVKQLIERVSREDEWDIFEDLGDALFMKGDKVKYSIKRNGEHIAMVEHPYSYEQLQEQFGGGSFQIICRSSLQKKFIKSQSRMIAAPIKKLEVKSEAPPEKKESSELSILALMQQMQEKSELERKREKEEAKIEAREREEKLKAEANTTTMLMMKMMEQQQAAQQQFMTTLVTMMSGKREEPREDKRMDKMFDLLLTSLLDKKGKGESIDPIELMKLTQEAEEKGYRRAQEIREIAEEQAEILAARNSGKEEGEPEEKESVTQTLLKSMAPLFATAMMPGAAPRQMPQQAVKRVAVNPHLPARPAPKPLAAPKAPEAAKPAAPTPTPVAAKPASTKPITGFAGLPTRSAITKKPEETVNQKKLIEETVITEIGKDLQANFFSGNFQPEATADSSMKILEAKGITPQQLCSQYTLSDMMEVAKAKGLPERINQYLERFYAHCQAKAAVGAGKAPEHGELEASSTRPGEPEDSGDHAEDRSL